MAADSKVEPSSGVWSWAERERVHSHIVHKRIKKEGNAFSLVDLENSQVQVPRQSSSGTAGREDSSGDGRNGMFFSSGAKKAWWTARPLPAAPSRGLPSPSSSSSAVAITADLDNYLFSSLNGEGADPDDLDLEFGFGTDDKDEDLYDALSSSNIQSDTDKLGPKSSAPDSLCRVGRPISERLFSCSTDYLFDCVPNGEGRASQPAGRRGMSAIIASMKAAISESESRKAAPPPLPGKNRRGIAFHRLSKSSLQSCCPYS